MASNSNGETYMGDVSETHEGSTGPRTRIFHRTFNFIRGPMEPTFAGLIISHGEMKNRMMPNHQSLPKINLGSDGLTVLAFGSTSSSGNTIFGFDPTTGRAVASVVKDASLVPRFLNARVVGTHLAWVILAHRSIWIARAALSASEDPGEDHAGQNPQREQRQSSSPPKTAGGLMKWTTQVDVSAIRRPLNEPYSGFRILAQIFAGRQRCHQSFPVIRDVPQAHLRGLNNIWDLFHNNASDSF